jgi:hypothetical protein
MLIISVMLIVAGCYEIERKIFLNPDGRRKARIGAAFPRHT